MTPTPIRIDRLSLRVPGLDQDAAEDLARLVALRLAGDLWLAGDLPAAAAAWAPGSRQSGSGGPTLRLEISAPADLDGLAWRIAGEIRQALEHEAQQTRGAQ